MGHLVNLFVWKPCLISFKYIVGIKTRCAQSIFIPAMPSGGQYMAIIHRTPVFIAIMS